MKFNYKELDFENDHRLTHDVNGDLRKNNPDEHSIYLKMYKGEECVKLMKKAPFSLNYIKLILNFASIGLWNDDVINPDNLINYERLCLNHQNEFSIGTCPTDEYVDILRENAKYDLDTSW